jgi:hypothetical protein
MSYFQQVTKNIYKVLRIWVLKNNKKILLNKKKDKDKLPQKIQNKLS